MAATTAPTLRRATRGRVAGGVAAGIGQRLGIDPLLVRVAFLAAAMAGGLGVAAYLLLWALLPAGEGGRALVRTGRGAVEVALGTGLLVLAALLAFRSAGIWFSDAIVWPAVLLAAGGALIWRQSQQHSAPPEPVAAPPAERLTRHIPDVSRTGLGVVLVVAAALIFLDATGALGAARDVALAAVVVAIALAVIFAPFTVRLARSLASERSQRMREQERAEVAAHLHDSVLQTLALVQKRSGDPQQVAALARRQERELRAWLAGRGAPGARRLTAALEAAAADVEDAHGVAVEVVAVGERPLDQRVEALVAAAREAMVNAAKHGAGEGGTVSVYAETKDGTTTVFVRDRGGGFDPTAIPPDRHGVRDSILARMDRHGGRAQIHAAPGGGTEVELWLP
jgi:signal transduction histidine kinase